jgi:hypothetical protein
MEGEREREGSPGCYNSRKGREGGAAYPRRYLSSVHRGRKGRLLGVPERRPLRLRDSISFNFYEINKEE